MDDELVYVHERQSFVAAGLFVLVACVGCFCRPTPPWPGGQIQRRASCASYNMLTSGGGGDVV